MQSLCVVAVWFTLCLMVSLYTYAHLYSELSPSYVSVKSVSAISEALQGNFKSSVKSYDYMCEDSHSSK